MSVVHDQQAKIGLTKLEILPEDIGLFTSELVIMRRPVNSSDTEIMSLLFWALTKENTRLLLPF